MAASRLAEVRWGEAQEGSVLRAWLRSSPRCSGAVRFTKTRPGAAFDYIVVDSNSFPVAYVEVKVRRIPFGDFGDAVAPLRKHDVARDLRRKHRIPLILVTRYACGTIVECDLAERPAEMRELKRHDRPNGVTHGLWRGRQLTVITPATLPARAA